MFTDIALPKGNEEEFIEIALRLGIKKIYFLYNFDGINSHDINEKFNKLKDYKNIHVEIGFIANQKNIHKALQNSGVIAAKSSNNDRYFIETKKVKLIYGFEESQKKDYLSQRASGLNHVTCELLRKNGVSIGFSYSLLNSKDSNTNSIIIGRVIQNIRLFQKYRVKTIIGSFSDNPYKLKSPHDVSCLFSMLGMDRRKINESLNSGL